MRNRLQRFVRPGALALVGLVGSGWVGAVAQAPSSDRWTRQGSFRLNQSTIGLAAGLTEGAPLRLAAELGRTLDDGDQLRILPIVTRGIFENFGDLLQLRGVDAAIVYGDTLEYFQKVEKVPRVSEKIRFIASLFPSEMQILVRPEIKSIADLAGKNVNFNSKGTAAAFTGPMVFDKLGIKINAKFDPHPNAMKEMKTSDAYSAVVFVTTKPVVPLAADWPAGFKLLEVPYTKELEDSYIPATLDPADYPKLIPQGSKIQTIAVPVVLAVYNWSPASDRYARLVRFVDALFEKLPALQKEPNHPAWKNVNLAASVPGWQRFGPVTRRLQLAGRSAGQ
jgi:TRAP-type uncharacterized transport system substrate-binding protein